MRADGVKLHFEEARGRAPADAEIRDDGEGARAPVFAYSYEIIDNRQRQRRRARPEGRGPDDVPDREERRARAAAFETQANLRNLSGEGLLLHDGRFDISNMMPGDVKRVAFTFDVGAEP